MRKSLRDSAGKPAAVLEITSRGFARWRRRQPRKKWLGGTQWGRGRRRRSRGAGDSGGGGVCHRLGVFRHGTSTPRPSRGGSQRSNRGIAECRLVCPSAFRRAVWPGTRRRHEEVDRRGSRQPRFSGLARGLERLEVGQNGAARRRPPESRPRRRACRTPDSSSST